MAVKGGLMPLDTLKFNDNEQEHKSIGDTLGLLQGGVVSKTYDKNSQHAYYSGHELAKKDSEHEDHKEADGYYLKMDVPGKGSGGPNSRTQNRVIVRVNKDGQLDEGWAAFWRHDDRIMKLDTGFFKRAKTLRDYKISLKK